MNYEKTVKGEFEQISQTIINRYLEQNKFWSVTESYQYEINGFQLEIVLLEKMKTTLSERIALQITFMQNQDEVIINAIATGFEGLLFFNGPEGKKAVLKKVERIINELAE